MSDIVIFNFVGGLVGAIFSTFYGFRAFCNLLSGGESVIVSSF